MESANEVKTEAIEPDGVCEPVTPVFQSCLYGCTESVEIVAKPFCVGNNFIVGTAVAKPVI